MSDANSTRMLKQLLTRINSLDLSKNSILRHQWLNEELGKSAQHKSPTYLLFYKESCKSAEQKSQPDSMCMH